MPDFPPTYAAMRAFTAPARGHEQLWRTGAGLAVAIIFYLTAMRGLVMVIEDGLGPLQAAALLDDMADGSSPPGLLSLLLSYLPLGIGLALACRLLLNRGWQSLIGPFSVAWPSFLWVAAALCLMYLLMMPLQVMSPDVGAHLPFGRQLPWLPLALAGLLVQTGVEELLFRGYLQQQLATRFQNPLVWMALPSALFAVLHYQPFDYGANSWFVMGWAFLFGLAAADLTARTGNLGAAIGLHFATDASSLFMVGLYGHLDGLALYNRVINLWDTRWLLPYLVTDFLSLLVGWLAARVILRV